MMDGRAAELRLRRLHGTRTEAVEIIRSLVDRWSSGSPPRLDLRLNSWAPSPGWSRAVHESSPVRQRWLRGSQWPLPNTSMASTRAVVTPSRVWVIIDGGALGEKKGSSWFNCHTARQAAPGALAPQRNQASW